MGRRTGAPGHAAYQVKNTFVELVASEEAESPYVHGVRSNRALSANDVDQLPSISQDDKFQAQTPSPFLHPARAPDDATLMAIPPMAGYDLGGAMPIAFGEIPADYNVTGFNEEVQGNYALGGFMYDPSSGMYMACDWQQQQMYNSGCYPMMGDMQGGLGEFQIDGCMPMPQNGGNNHTEHLLQALSEKLAAGKGPDGTDGTAIYGGLGYGENGMPMPEAMGGPCDILPGQEAYMDSCAEIYPGYEHNGVGGGHEHGQQQSERGSRKNRRDRERADRGDRGDGGERETRGDAKETEAPQQQGPVNFTTVMFRNIPNKYTREMLVNQLEQDLKGQFDFVYLPIDFKNKCNVGYAFINFRTVEACEAFLNEFNGVEVRKCLPGLNSRKVTEVTPARVQGFEENVQRLRNSPVMRELAHHAEWMPLIFDEHGDLMTFPAPERPLEPIKPRRRGREEAMRD